MPNTTDQDQQKLFIGSALIIGVYFFCNSLLKESEGAVLTPWITSLTAIGLISIELANRGQLVSPLLEISTQEEGLQKPKNVTIASLAEDFKYKITNHQTHIEIRQTNNYKKEKIFRWQSFPFIDFLKSIKSCSRNDILNNSSKTTLNILHSFFQLDSLFQYNLNNKNEFMINSSSALYHKHNQLQRFMKITSTTITYKTYNNTQVLYNDLQASPTPTILGSYIADCIESFAKIVDNNDMCQLLSEQDSTKKTPLHYAIKNISHLAKVENKTLIIKAVTDIIVNILNDSTISDDTKLQMLIFSSHKQASIFNSMVQNTLSNQWLEPIIKSVLSLMGQTPTRAYNIQNHPELPHWLYACITKDETSNQIIESLLEWFLNPNYQQFKHDLLLTPNTIRNTLFIHLGILPIVTADQLKQLSHVVVSAYA